MNYKFENSKKYASDMDLKDELKDYRDDFYINDAYIYMDGNSLGLFPKAAEKSLLDVIENFKTLIHCFPVS